jgi:hypothetical protein
MVPAILIIPIILNNNALLLLSEKREMKGNRTSTMQLQNVAGRQQVASPPHEDFMS